MNAADIQTTGLIGLAGAIVGVLLALSKGMWEIVRDIRLNRREQQQATISHSKSLTDAAQEGLMALNSKLNEDNDRLRRDFDTAKARILHLETEVDTLRTEALQLKNTIQQLTGRMAALESRDADGI